MDRPHTNLRSIAWSNAIFCYEIQYALKFWTQHETPEALLAVSGKAVWGEPLVTPPGLRKGD